MTFFLLGSVSVYLNNADLAILLLAVPRRLFCFGSLVIIDLVCHYLSCYINIEIGKNRLAGDHLFEK